jgi:hypothetical protein
MKKRYGLPLMLFSIFSSTAFAESVSIDDESFGVFYENPMNTDKGLVLYISNKNCFGSYRIARNELLIGNGDINARGPEKIIPFGTARFRLDCGPQQSLLITRQ